MDFAATTLNDDTAKGRFELLDSANVLGFMDYRSDGLVRSITHTEVPDGLQGQGVASHLTERVLQQLKNQGLKVNPLCPFVADYIAQHPAWAELVENH